MKKSDLKPGMICELSDGTFGIVFFGHYEYGDCIICPDGYLRLSNLDENLQDKAPVGDCINVISVYKSNCLDMYELTWRENHKEMPESWEKIRERKPELVELTLEEVAKKFGINVKSLRIKE